MATKKIASEEAQTTALSLVVTKSVAGVLETNIARLEELVAERLEEYDAAKYKGDADAAKKDRAELNNAKKLLAQERIALMRELMRPYADFEARCKALEKQIEAASARLDEIVKQKEEIEKAVKRQTIEALWRQKKFDYMPLEKIFNPKWLNKTVRIEDIGAEMDAAIAKIMGDIKVIERAVGDDADAAQAKARYFTTLDVSDALNFADELERMRAAALRERAERGEREHDAKIEAQRSGERAEWRDVHKDAQAARLADAALEIESAPEIKEFALFIKATEFQFLKLKEAATALDIEYREERR